MAVTISAIYFLINTIDRVVSRFKKKTGDENQEYKPIKARRNQCVIKRTFAEIY